jgi:hypothetical protein
VIPGEVIGLIKETSSIILPGLPTDQHECQGAKFHSPRPMIVQSFEISRSTGQDEIVYLCGTCTDNVKVLLALLRARNGDVPWTVKRCFGNLVRGVAGQVYARPVEENHHA